MPPFVQNSLARATDFWKNISLPQRVLLGGLLASLLIVLSALLFWMNRTEYKVLYSHLYQEDAAGVVNFLKKEKIPYEIADSGSTILVPESHVYEARLKLAGENVLHGQGIGFELFDENKIGQTNFVQNINYQRALQGELSRTISELPEVESARVHLVLPSKSLFVEEQAPPSAAIMLKLSGGRSLAQQQVQAIVNLVSTSVEGLGPEHITVADSRGKVLYEPRSDTDMAGMTSTQLEYQMNVQRQLEQRVEQLLTPIVGPGRAIVRVNADLDFDRTTIRKETFDPKSAVVRSEVKNEEENRGAANVGGGTPDPNYRGENDLLSGSGTTQESTRTSSTTNFDINREERQIVAQIGAVKRLSVAVLVDGKYVTQQDGSRTFEPLGADQLAQIRQLAQRAVGFDEVRGDAIEVSSIAFGDPVEGESFSALDTASRYFQLLGKPVLNVLVILLFLFFVVRPVVLALLRPKVEDPTVQEQQELGAAEEMKALTENMSEEDLAAVDAAKRIENAKYLAQQMVEQNMDQAVLIMRQWLAQGEA
ncbi:MAG: flagellar basal-body MS-ring/collar protein FliF [Pseudomonadota bacterium]|nr:flagellar basal-body MS-ring/collar protein FliF [Pseudomonadota bacterium]